MLIELLIYKIFGFITGLVFAWLGYSLFRKGIFNDAGNAEAAFGDNRILLKRAAPGTFFAVIGGIIAVMVVFSGLSVEKKYENDEKIYEKGGGVSIEDESQKLKSRLVIRSDVDDYQVYINEKAEGKSAINIVLDPGMHSIRIVKKGYKTFSARVELEADQGMVLFGLMQRSYTK